MATATQLAPIAGLGTERWSRASRQFIEAQRQNIPGQGAEVTLVLAARNGDPHAFEILVELYQRRILAVARRFTRNREDAEDIAQQSLQKASSRAINSSVVSVISAATKDTHRAHGKEVLGHPTEIESNSMMKGKASRTGRFQRNYDGKETMSLQRALSRSGLMRPNGAVGF